MEECQLKEIVKYEPRPFLIIKIARGDGHARGCNLCINGKKAFVRPRGPIGLRALGIILSQGSGYIQSDHRENLEGHCN